MKPKVLVSYSHKDMDQVKAVASILSQAGCDVWQDTDKIAGGDRMIPKISQALAESDYYLIFVSEDSMKSNYVLFELSLAMSLQIKKEKPRIIPITLDNTTLPDMLQDIKYIKFESVSQTAKEITKAIALTGPIPSPTNEKVEQMQEINLMRFSFYLCEETRLIDSFRYDELLEKIVVIATGLRRIANKLVLSFINVEDIEIKSNAEVNFPNVSFTEFVNDTGAKDVLTKQICIETEILNPNDKKIMDFISKPNSVKAITYAFLLPSPIPNLPEIVIKKILMKYPSRIEQFDSQSITYDVDGKKYTVSATDQQIKVKVDAPMPIIRNSDVEKFDIRDIVKKLLP